MPRMLKPLHRDQLAGFLRNHRSIRQMEATLQAVETMDGDFIRQDLLQVRGDLIVRGVTDPIRLPVGSNGQLLASDGTDVLWLSKSPTITLGTDLSGNVTLANLNSGTLDATIEVNAVTNAKLRDSAALSVIGNATNALADPADIVGTDGQVLRVSGTTLAFGTISAASITDIVETAQDAVGAALANSTTVTLTYVDATPSITAALVAASVGNTFLSNMAQSRVKGRAEGAGIGEPTDLTPTEVVAIIDGEAAAWTGQHQWTQVLLGPAGNAGNPTFSTTGDPDTGMYSSAANQIGFSIAGTLRAYLDGNGYFVTSTLPAYNLIESDQAADEQRWRTAANSRVYRVDALNDAASLSANALGITRGVGATPSITAITLGNTTDNPTLNCLGTGTKTFGGVLRAPDGDATTPGYSWSGDTNCGWYRIGADNVGFSGAGTLRWDISTTAVTSTVPERGPNGTAAAPTYSWSGDVNNGLYYIGTDQWGLSANSTLQLEIGDTYSDQKTQARYTGVTSPAQLVANTNDWTGAAGAFSKVRFSTDAARNITGATGGVAGREVTFVNIGTQTAVFTNNDAASTAGNRFLNAAGGNKTVQAGGSITYWYDGTSAAWRQMHEIA